jgi:catechol 2,3-dioxygenase-like lactoylglutathione lyase family enzyme
MNLGWCDVCLRVKDVGASRAFYEALGFWRVEGSDEEGWGVITNGQQRLGLFIPEFMASEFTLNFRGGDIRGICSELESKGVTFTSGPKFNDKGGTAGLIDPDGHAISIDSAVGETMKIEPI